MLLFGHSGITLGVAALLANALPSGYFSRTTGNEAIASPPPFSQVPPTISYIPRHRMSWFVSLGTHVDIRLLVIASILPDIIDKPLGIYIFGEAISNGRIFCHTLLFLFLVTMAGVYLYRSSGKTHLFAVSFGILTHLIFDQMWRNPRTLFWPVLGLTFDRADAPGWLISILNALLTDPATYLPELAGAVILGWFAITLMLQRKALRFLKSGKV
ncbi:metal-dependent hydrolase [Chloroflexota bacterium]